MTWVRDWVWRGMLTTLLGTAGLLTAAWGQATPPAAEEAEWFRNVRQLTSKDMGLVRSGEAYFSADGRRVCFQAIPAGGEEYQIYIINFDGSGLKRVSTGVGATTCSFFHPSGEKLIFAANHHDLRPPRSPEEFEPVRARGGREPASQPAPATASAPAGSSGPQHRGRGSYAWKYFPGMDIFEYTLASGELKQLTHSDGYDAECAYSPDGKHIVFTSFRDGDGEIYICDADGANPRRITHAKGTDGGPFFSPDGQRLVYRSDRYGDGNLQVMVNNVAGTDERALTGHNAFHWCPYWHPSGKWVIFTRADFSGRPNFDLCLLCDDGSEMYRVTTDSTADVLPAFSNDGRYLMWASSRGGLDAPQVFIAEFSGLTPAGELRAHAAALDVSGRPK